MIFDFRVFLGRSFDGVQQTVGELLRRMDTLAIDMALVCPLKPASYDLDLANATLAACIEDHADRLLGAARVDPWQPDAPESLRRALETHGLRAVFLNPWEECFQAEMSRLDPLMDVAARHKVPILIASGYPWLSESLQVCALARRWPDVPVVMSNGGQINISGLGQADAALALRRAHNLHVDTAGVYRQDFIEGTVQEMGAERVLFASGAPYLDQRYEVKRVLWADVDDSARRAMQSGNARLLLGLDR
jgi:hypothetical protein